MKTIGIRVSGKVQGVFFRQSTRDEARKLDIGGIVRNEENGEVYIEATGDDGSLAKLLEWCRQGPPKARVTTVNSEELPLKVFPDFSIDR